LTSDLLSSDGSKREAVPAWRSGWEGILSPIQRNRSYQEYSAFRKTSGDFTLEREELRKVESNGTVFYNPVYWPSRRGARYTLTHSNGQPPILFEAHWADWDQRGRLVATVGGRVLEGSLTQDGKLLWRQLAAFQDEKFAPMVAPEWAQHW
jgi:hypothetical protein